MRKNKEIIEIICSNSKVKIRIWDFHRGELIKTINVESKNIYGISLWKNDCLCAGCWDKLIKIIDIKDNKYIELKGHNDIPNSISILTHQKFGGKNDIIIWQNINSKFEMKKTILLYS